MSNEANKAMDDQLKAYAEARRREAPEAFELDAVARRRLHEEVRRVYLEKPEPENSRVGWWVWMRVGLAAAAVVVLIVSVRMASRDEPLLLTKSDSAPELAEADVANEALAPTASQTRLLADADMAETTPMAGVALETAAPAQTQAEMEMKREGREEALDSMTLAGAPAPAAAPTAATPTIAPTSAFYVATPTGGVERFLGTAGQEFLQVQRYRLNPNSPPVPQVLQNFRWARDGDAVQVIDADGSVYTGQMVAVVPVQARRSVAAASDRTALMRDQAVQLQPIARQDGERFTVSGTNQTLNTRIEFEGFILPVSTANQPAAAGARASGDASAALQIQGQAMVGGSTRLEIVAVPRE